MKIQTKKIRPHSYHVIEIPVAAHVKRVLLKTEKVDLDGHFHFCENSVLGEALANISAELPFEDAGRVPGDIITVKVSQRLWNRFCKWESYQVLRMGVFYEKIVQRIMCAWIDAYWYQGGSQQAAIEAIFDHFQLEEEEYSREALMELYKRLRTIPPKPRARRWRKRA